MLTERIKYIEQRAQLCTLPKSRRCKCCPFTLEVIAGIKEERRIAEEEEEESEDEWKRIVYYLVDAVGAVQGNSIPEDVENAKQEIDRMKKTFTS